MDIARFINSPDVRDHIRNVGYQFTSTEAAWLIWQCRLITLAERHDAWRTLIRTMADEKIEKRHLTREWPSLHEYLEKLISFEKRLVDAFYEETQQTFYTCSIWLPKLQKSEEYRDNYLNDQDCQRFIMDVYGDDYKREDADQIRIKVCKHWIGKDAPYMMIEYNAKWEIMSVLQNGVVVEDICAECDDFEGMWFNFPTPFKKGDIVVGSCLDRCWMRSDIFVLEGVITDDKSFVERRKSGWDNSDMIAWGAFQEEDGRIFHECMPGYMDLKYYHGEFPGVRRILQALSSFWKDEVPIELFVNAYHAILMEAYVNNIYPRYFTDEGMALVGLKNRKEG